MTMDTNTKIVDGVMEIIDFLNFKIKNELTHCTFLNQEDKDNETKIMWTMTRKYTNSFSSKKDVEKINQDLIQLVEENKVLCRVSKITCAENCHIVEFVLCPKNKL